MKSEHRHELKSNELADWLNNFPQWAKDNLSSILIVVGAIVIVAGYFGWKSVSQSAQSSEHEEFTTLVDNVLGLKAQIVGQQGSDMSYILISQASDMEQYAAKSGNNNIAALALVKAGDAIRTELQYRNEVVEQSELVDAINRAKKDYTDALAKKPTDVTVKAAAEFGLGLCAEELGNFEEAKDIYNSILENKNYEGTVVMNKVQLRLEVMDDYETDIVFQPAPEIEIPDVNASDVNDRLDPFIKQLRELSGKTNDSNNPLPSIIDTNDANTADSAIESVIPVDTNTPIEIAIPDDSNNLEQ